MKTMIALSAIALMSIAAPAFAAGLSAKDVDAAGKHLARLEAAGSDDSATLELRARVLKAQGKAAEAVTTLARSS